MSDNDTHELITDQAGREASGAHPYGRYLEEFEVGAVYKHWPAKTVTESDDHLFCLITMNHHPLHLNDVYAGESQQGRNVVVGPLVYSLALGMSVSDVSGKAIANLATEELSHPNPVFHGDTLYCESEVLEVRPSQSKPDRGIVKVHTRVYKQDNTLVAEFKRTVLDPAQEPRRSSRNPAPVADPYATRRPDLSGRPDGPPPWAEERRPIAAARRSAPAASSTPAAALRRRRLPRDRHAGAVRSGRAAAGGPALARARRRPARRRARRTRSSPRSRASTGRSSRSSRAWSAARPIAPAAPRSRRS